MTNNQLTYFRDAETKRHNLAMEQIGLQTLEETRAANRASQQQAASALDLETRRYMDQLRETNRANQARENIDLQRNKLTALSNWAQLQETMRANRAREAQAAVQTSLNYQASIYASNVSAMNAANALAETNRHNLATEGLTATSNPWQTGVTVGSTLLENAGKIGEWFTTVKDDSLNTIWNYSQNVQLAMKDFGANLASTWDHLTSSVTTKQKGGGSARPYRH